MRSLSSLAMDIVQDVEIANGTILNVNLREAGDYLVEKIKEGYDQQEMSGPELAQTTIQRKGNDIKLIDTGAMRDSFESSVVGKQLTVGSDYMEAEIGKPLCEIHEDGTSDGHIPARPMLKMIIEREEPQIDAILIKLPD